MNYKDYLDIGLTLGVGILYVATWLKQRFARKKQKQHTLDHNAVIDGRIYPILWELCLQFSALRVYLTQFHNGTNFYTGQSIQRQTVSHEVAKSRSISKVKENHDGVLISEMNHRIIMSIREYGYYLVESVSDVKGSFPDLYDWMKVYEVESLLYVRLIDTKTRETVATLNFHFDKNNPVTDEQIDEILEMKKRLESIFDRL